MKRALVIGCGQRVWQDVEKALLLCNWDRYYVVNLAGVYWTGRDHFIWVTLHPEQLRKFKAQRLALLAHSNYEIVAPSVSEANRGTADVHRRTSYRWPGMTTSGSVGLFAVKVALEDGADRVVLAGVPMSSEPHFATKKSWTQFSVYRDAWIIAAKFYQEKTRSLSGGWTEELLGSPTKEWLIDD